MPEARTEGRVATRYGRRVRTVVIVAVAFVLAAEMLVRMAAPRLPDPTRWYHPLADRRAGLLAELKERGVDPDVVFLGSSSVAGGLDPLEFERADTCGRSAFNAGVPGATPGLLGLWLQDAVLGQVEPDLVVLGFTSRDLAVGSSSRAYDAYVRSPAARHGRLATAERWLEDRSYLIRFRSVLRDPLRVWRYARGARTKDEIRAAELDAGGFNHERLPTPYHAATAAQKALVRDFVLDVDQVERIGEMLSELADRGIEAVMASMPVSSEWVTEHGRGAADYARFEDALRRVAEEHGVRVVDLTDIEAESFFIDPVHLSPDGARVATARLARELAAACGQSSTEQPIERGR